MGKIFVMPDALASQVAAGEVVDRPSSVLKELLENAIDAGATRIEVFMERGGKGLLRVIDNGHGMDRQDALLALERHATSKIRHKEDLERISTLGFRGEALPSIASVCRFQLRTREAESLAGTEIVVDGGRLKDVRDWGGAPGTDIEIRSIFHNMPGRRKFLRSNETESAHCESVLRIQALARPGIGFSLVKDGRPVFQLPPGESQRDRVAGFLGRAMADRLLAVDGGDGAVGIRGLIAPPGLSRSDRSLQLVFVNQRPVESAVISVGLREGYRNALMKGEYPVTFLFLEMDPAEYDVNVHPAKKEIKFRDGNRVRDLLAGAARDAIGAGRESPLRVMLPGRRPEDGRDSAEATSPARSPGESAAGSIHPEIRRAARPEDWSAPELIPEREQRGLRKDWADPGFARSGELAETRETKDLMVDREPAARIEPPRPDSATAKAAAGGSVADWRFLGVLNRLYVLLESPEGLVLMDQHAAHERVLFEQMQKALETQGVPSQRLLLPLTWDLPALEFDLLMRNRDVLARFGVNVEEFGPRTVKIDSVPILAKDAGAEEFLKSVLAELRTSTSLSGSARLGEDVIASTVCRHAVKARDSLREEELRKLLLDLFECDMPYCCPHGRPTVIQISTLELEKKFGRRA